ncbi:iron transporter FeoA [Nostoc sp. ATCC 43529]|nr:iron transporter FeoA [Nostoc sp. ATCC 43529]
MFTPFSVTGCSLELLRVGEQGIITFCKIEDETNLKKLISKGITPGKYITVQQGFPLVIIKLENTSLSVDIETARAIYVRIINH